MVRTAITAEQLPAPVGPFSMAIRDGGLLFLSGQVAQDPATGELIDGDTGRQTEQILNNLAAVVAAAGKSLADVVRVGVYLTDMADFATMNEEYSRHFTAPYPARTTIGVAALPLGATVEIDAVVA
ncbi:Rid family detoxifying hydrolase [Micromonospora sp. NPDC049891]|uniref:Rid family detoxifying hydrolase n=1 Tax=Micromonospora sp. NPDC049891 TaxID=3155655 RepID=UPI0033E875C8